MAVAYNNIKVPTDGLVLYYDMHNPKSWKGEPTVNQLLSPNDMTDSGVWAYAGATATEHKLVETSESSASWILQNSSVTLGLTYTQSVSAKYAERRYIQLAPSSGFSSSNYVNFDLLDKVFQVYGSGDASMVELNDGWVRCSFSVPSTATVGGRFAVGISESLGSVRLPVYIGTPGYGVFLKEHQFEQKSYPTPFVLGERTTTQAVLDLTSKNTLTANNLTYSSENTFSFSDNSNNISIPFSNEFDFSSGQTICMWMKPTGSATRRNPYDQAYGGSGTITYETARTFNYYFGTHGGNSSPYVGRNSGFTVAADELAFVCVSRDQGLNQCDWYKNDTHKTSLDAGGYAATNNGSSQIRVGLGYTGNGGFIGDIYSLALFKRKLSDEEILSMFEMSRHRYGM